MISAVEFESNEIERLMHLLMVQFTSRACCHMINIDRYNIHYMLIGRRRFNNAGSVY